jgi:hypothetical protein
MLRLRYTQHAHVQMADRGISRQEVEMVITDAESTRPSDKGPNKRIFTRWVGKRRIGVVVVPDDPSPEGAKLVITTFIEAEEE